MERFEFLGKKSRTETNIAKKQYQKLDNTFVFDKTIKKEGPIFENHNKSNLIYLKISIFFTNIIVMIKNLIIFLSNQSICFYTIFLKIN